MYKQFAVPLYKRGLQVIPLMKGTKRPFIKEWSKYSEQKISQETFDLWISLHENGNIGLVLGKSSELIAIDVDTEDQNIYEIIKKIIPPSPLVKKGKKGGTAFFKYNGESSEKIYLNGKPIIELLSTGNQTVLPPSIHPDTGKSYTWLTKNNLENCDLEKIPVLPPGAWNQLKQAINTARTVEQINPTDTQLQQGRNNKLKEIATAAFYKGKGIENITRELVIYDKTHHTPPLFIDANEMNNNVGPETNALKFASNILASINLGRIKENLIPLSPFPVKGMQKNGPAISLDSPAFHGPIGEMIKSIAGSTEASAIAILIQVLVGIGTMLGKNIYCYLGSKKIYGNLFGVIVGKSSKARKGTSWWIAKEILLQIDSSNFSSRIHTGVTSGEGIIHNVRDKLANGSEEDPGSPDKRLLLIEQEFSNVLRVSGREQNTTSQILRDAWDGNTLQTLAKNSPTRAENAHISMIGHITSYELKKDLKTVQIFNGLGNRCLWVYAERSKILASLGRKDRMVVPQDILKELKVQLSNIKNEVEIDFSNDAYELWKNIYQGLSIEKIDDNHEQDAIKARAEEQIIRMALILAFCDGLTEIRPQHLIAAKSIWDYCEQSIDFIFGNEQLLTHSEEKIIQALRKKQKLTRTEVRDVFSKNKSKNELDDLGRTLEQKGIITISSNKDSEIWFIKDYDYTTLTT